MLDVKMIGTCFKMRSRGNYNDTMLEKELRLVTLFRVVKVNV